MKPETLYETSSDGFIHCIINIELDMSRHLTARTLLLHLNKDVINGTAEDMDDSSVACRVMENYNDLPMVDIKEFKTVDEALDYCTLNKYDFSRYSPSDKKISKLVKGIVTSHILIEDATYNTVSISFFGFGDTYKEAVDDLLDTFEKLHIDMDPDDNLIQ